MADEPTAGELSRRFDDLARRLDRIAEAVAQLPTVDLVTTREARIADRVSQVERAVERALATIERLAAALDAEREARAAAIQTEQRDRTAAIAAEKGRVGLWLRWAFAGVLAALGTAVSQALGVGGRPAP